MAQLAMKRGWDSASYEVAKSEAEHISPRTHRAEADELSSIRSMADTQTRWILSEPMRVDFSKLKEKPTTVYVRRR
jgi:hypothetical protein